MSKRNNKEVHFETKIQEVESGIVEMPENLTTSVGESTITYDSENIVASAPSISLNTDSDDVIQRLANEVERGIHGSGRERMLSLGVNYAKVQQEVTRRIRNR